MFTTHRPGAWSRSTSAVLALALAGCGDDAPPKSAPSGTPAQAATPAEPMSGWKTFRSEKGTTELDQARYLEFSFRYPSSWERDLEHHKTDERLFVDLMNHDGQAAHAFVVRSFKRTPAPMAEVLDATLESQRKGLGVGETLKVLAQGPVRAGGVDGHEFVYLQTGPRGATWMRIVLLPVAATEWGALMLRLQVGSVDPRKDVVAIAAKSDLQAMLDSLTITPPK